MSIEPEERSFAPRKTPRKHQRNKPYTLSQLSDRLDDLHDVADELLEALNAWRNLGHKAYKWGKVLIPAFIGALLASGVVTGPLGEVLKFISANYTVASGGF